MKKDKKIIIVQGAQWGSESKGMVAHALAIKENVKFAVRTGSINAGHSIIMPDGNKFAFQQLPTAAALPGVTSVIGPGAYISYETLHKEMEIAKPQMVLLDHQCGVHLEEYTEEAKEAGRSLKIGATGKGCAESIVHKIKDRGNGQTPLLYKKLFGSVTGGRAAFKDTVEFLTDVYHGNFGQILIEGTQGTLLDFHLGPYPYVTSRQTISSAWVTEAGLSPTLNYEVVLVARTYPIRVAGNSGPMSNEINWPLLTRRINRKLEDYKYDPIVREEILEHFESKLAEAKSAYGGYGVEQDLYANTDAILSMNTDARAELLKFFETTTVTKRLRRIAELDRMQLRNTVKKENPAYMVLTFLNYEFPEVVHTRQISTEILTWLEKLQSDIKCWIKYVTIGPRAEDMIETPQYLYAKSLGYNRF